MVIFGDFPYNDAASVFLAFRPLKDASGGVLKVHPGRGKNTQAMPRHFVTFTLGEGELVGIFGLMYKEH